MSIAFFNQKWNCIAFWKYNTDVDDCVICRNNLSETCINCQQEAIEKLEFKQINNCTVVWGECSVIVK